jgi:hypothetical protein
MAAISTRCLKLAALAARETTLPCMIAGKYANTSCVPHLMICLMLIDGSFVFELFIFVVVTSILGILGARRCRIFKVIMLLKCVSGEKEASFCYDACWAYIAARAPNTYNGAIHVELLRVATHHYRRVAVNPRLWSCVCVVVDFISHSLSRLCRCGVVVRTSRAPKHFLKLCKNNWVESVPLQVRQADGPENNWVEPVPLQVRQADGPASTVEPALLQEASHKTELRH